MTNDYLQVSTVADSRDTAVKLARAAIAAKLAAGAQVHGPLASFFWHTARPSRSGR